MFSAGEIIVYGLQGVCEISDITEMRIGEEMRSYYILRPVNDNKSTVYVPVDNEWLISQMREVLTRSEVDCIIDEVAGSKFKWIENDTERKTFCESVIKNGDRKELIRLVSMLYVHREELKNNKKRFQIADDKHLKEAEKQINDEFSYVLGISQEEVSAYIRNKING